jgi:hypothetical protein
VSRFPRHNFFFSGVLPPDPHAGGFTPCTPPSNPPACPVHTLRHYYLCKEYNTYPTKNPLLGPQAHKTSKIPQPSLRLGAPSSTSLLKSQKWSNTTNVSSKLGQGPIGPENAPMTRPESLRSGQHCFKGLELSSSYLDLLLCQRFLLNELLNYLFCNRPFQALFHCRNHFFQLRALSFDLFKKRVGFILDQLESLCNIHDSSLDGSNLLLDCVLFL